MLILVRPISCSIPPLQEICGHCLQLSQENQARISHLESYLQQYGYQPQASFSIPLKPSKLVKSAGMHDTETVMQCYQSSNQPIIECPPGQQGADKQSKHGQ